MKQIGRFISQTSVLIVLSVMFVVVFLLGVVKDGLSQKSILNPQKDQISIQRSQPTQTNTSPNTNTLNLNGSYICKNASTSAFLDNKKLFVQFQTASSSSRILFRGDCLYSWNMKSTGGWKTCGLGQFIELYTLMKGTNLDFTFLAGMIGKNSLVSAFLKDQNVEGVDLSVLNSCKKSVVDAHVFELPKQVIFKESSKK